MTSQNSTYFQELTEREKTSKINQAVQSNGDFTIWCKGDKTRENFSSLEFSRDRMQVILESNVKSNNSDKNILYSFKLNGLNFFGKGKLKLLNQRKYVLEADDLLFKSERRNNFRLLTYPHHEVYISLPIPEEEAKKSNLYDINTKMSQTNLFKNFLNLIDDEKDDDKKFRSGFFPFRVIDLSVTGLAFQVGDYESKFFDEQKEFSKIILDFKGKELEIPKTEVVYNVSVLHSSSKQRNRKIGLKFLDIDTNLDEKLGNLINGALRDVESDFEDFI